MIQTLLLVEVEAVTPLIRATNRRVVLCDTLMFVVGVHHAAGFCAVSKEGSTARREAGQVR